MMVRFARTIGFSAVALSLAACGDRALSEVDSSEAAGINLARIVGITKNAPDEFAVTTSEPLQLPKDFAALPAPTPGVRSALTPNPVEKARSLLLGEVSPQPASARVSVSESALLSATGTAPASNIREVLAAEQAEIDENKEVYLLQRAFPSLQRGIENADAILPNEERVRLSEAQPNSVQRTEGIAVIRSAPNVSAPSAQAPLPSTDAIAGDELIYITE